MCGSLSTRQQHSGRASCRANVRGRSADFQPSRGLSAVREFTKLFALEPHDKQSYNCRGMASFRIGALAATIADFNLAIRLDGKFSEACLNRGTVRLALGDAERAAQDFSIVLQLEPRVAGEAYRLRSAAMPAWAGRRRRKAIGGVRSCWGGDGADTWAAGRCFLTRAGGLRLD